MKTLRTLLLGLFFIPLTLMAQKEKSAATLSATGSASMQVAPDWISVNMSLNAKHADYGEVTKLLTTKYNQLEKQLIMAGFRKEDLKTINYTINKNIVWNNGRSIDSGYAGNQSLLIEFDNDNKKIANLVKALSNGKVDVNFGFNFGLSERKKEETRQELIKKAVKDAESKAAVIASTANLKLSRIAKIDYGKTELNRPVPMYEMRAMKADMAAESFGGFNAQELELSDTIHIIWEVE